MSPEQAMGGDIDHRSDLYAFGVLLYQMLVGQTPFRADTPAATLLAHVHLPLPLPTSINPNIEPRVESSLLKAMAKGPDDRFQSARQMIQSISRATGGVATAPADEAGATAVFDASGLTDTGLTEDAATAVFLASAEAQAVEEKAAPEAEEVVAPPVPSAKGRWLLVGGGVAAAAVVAIVIAVVAFQGGEEPQVPPAEAAVAAPPVAGVLPAAPANASGGGANEAPAEPSGAPGGVAAAAAVPEPTATSEPESTPTPELAPVVSGPCGDTSAPASEGPTRIADAIARMDQVTSRAETNVVKLRQIEQAGEVTAKFRTKDDLCTITRGFCKRRQLREQVFEAQELYKVLGLMEEQQDFEEILIGIQIQTVSAMWDDEAELVYVISDATSIGPAEELAYATAYMAGIQQERFDTAGLRKRSLVGGSDEYRAVNALVAGDVIQVAKGYIQTVLTRDEVDELNKPLPENKLLQAPNVVQRAALFNQREGATFVSELFGTDDKGWEGVNEAYSRPPLSTEQILHPEKYFADEEPQRRSLPDFSTGLGKGWVQVSSNTMGEFLIRTYLEEHLDENQAADAAEGWGGDRYALLTGPEGQRLLISVTLWDTFQDAAEFLDAYQVFVGVKTQGAEVTSRKIDDGRSWVRGDETIFVARSGPAVMLIIGPDEPIVGKALELLAEALTPKSP